MESSRQIEERALAWLARRDSERWNEADKAGFSDWLRADTRHRVAYLRLEAGWERTARLKAFGVGKKAGMAPPPGQWRTSPFFERRPASLVRTAMKASTQKIAAVAAVALVVVGAGVYWKALGSGDGYATPVGAVTSIPLRDGSRMTLNTGSKVRVALTEKERRIELQAGEAFFDVAKDPLRPFVVDAGSRRVTAVGTQFSVRRDGNEVQVIVTQGKVRVETKAGGGGTELLAAGAVMRTARNSVTVRKKAVREAEEALSWRSGYLTFEETPLADAVAELNRYNSQHITIRDPKLAALRINGRFRSTNASDFVRLLQDGFDIQVRRDEDSIQLVSD